MRSSHSLDRLDTAFDDDRLVADAGLLLLCAHRVGPWSPVLDRSDGHPVASYLGFKSSRPDHTPLSLRARSGTTSGEAVSHGHAGEAAPRRRVGRARVRPRADPAEAPARSLGGPS